MSPIFFQALTGSPVNPSTGRIQGVSVMSKGPALGHPLEVDDTTLDQVTAAGQSRKRVPLMVNHGADLKGHVGDLLNFRREGDRVRADAELYDSHPDRAFVLEKAAKSPDSFGLSAEFYPGPDSPLHPVKFQGSKTKLTRCTSLDAVAFVRNPATNTGLFSGPEHLTARGDRAACFEVPAKGAGKVAFSSTMAGHTSVIELPASPGSEYERLALEFARAGDPNFLAAARHADADAFNAHMNALRGPRVAGPPSRFFSY